MPYTMQNAFAEELPNANSEPTDNLLSSITHLLANKAEEGPSFELELTSHLFYLQKYDMQTEGLW